MTIEDVLAAHTAQRQRLTDQVLATLAAQWRNLGSWDDADVSIFVSQVVPMIKGAQALTTRYADIYVSQALTEMLGKRVNPIGLSVPENLRGVPIEDVYRRPFVEIWTALKNGALFDDAVGSGEARLLEIGDDDLNLAYRKAVSRVMTDQPAPTRYRRVIRPEVTKTGACSLCKVASQNTYHTEDLLPIHTHCACDVLPIVGSLDPAQRLNDEDMPDNVTELPVVRDHGELGPTLQVKGQSFTNENALAA